MPACDTNSRCLPGGRQLSSALCNCRGPVGTETQGLAEWTLLNKELLKLKPIKNHPLLTSVQVKIICTDLYRWFSLWSLWWFVTCSAHLTWCEQCLLSVKDNWTGFGSTAFSIEEERISYSPSCLWSRLKFFQVGSWSLWGCRGTQRELQNCLLPSKWLVLIIGRNSEITAGSHDDDALEQQSCCSQLKVASCSFLVQISDIRVNFQT